MSTKVPIKTILFKSYIFILYILEAQKKKWIKCYHDRYSLVHCFVEIHNIV